MTLDWAKSLFRILIFPLIVGITAGTTVFVIKYYTIDEHKSLVFQYLVESHFPDVSTPVDIFSVRLANNGSQEIETIKCRIQLRKGRIEKVSQQKSTDLLEVVARNKNDHVADFVIPRLNPENFVTFNILAHGVGHAALVFEASGAGIDAKEQVSTAREGGSWLGYLSGPIGIVAAMLTLLSELIARRQRQWLASVSSLRATTERAAISAGTAQLVDQVREFLSRGDLELVFNPTSATGSKQISFEPDGSIGKGRNRNEFGWRQYGDTVEVLSQEGQVHNRFFLDVHSRQMKSTNDSDALAVLRDNILDQRIVPSEQTRKRTGEG